MNDLTAERVRELLDYDPSTGEFRWRVNRGRARRGNVAGCLEQGRYRAVQIAGRRLYLHRLAWLHSYGVWPSGEVDHINRDKSDNRLANLRVATKSQNKANAPKPCTNTSGYKGVRLRKGKWNSHITVNGKWMHLGVFKTQEDAAAAYASAAQKYFGEYGVVE